jgi:hypothetical protein
MATISFHADDNGITNLNGSGLGFYGSSFGSSVEVGSYQTSTFITDANGTIQGPQVNDNKWKHPGSGSINGLGSVALTQITNALATLNVRFSHTSAVKTQNSKLRIFDRTNINNPASGVTTKVAEIIHPDVVQNNNGSGDTTWNTPTGSAVIMDLVASPGMSGQRPNGSDTTADRHDYYVAISASPDSIGSKNLYGLYVELEYL